MPTTLCHYQLHFTAQSWRDALFGLSSYLPSHIHLDNITTIRSLPIFAAVLVVDNEVLRNNPTANIHYLMESWAEHRTGWALRSVQQSPTGTHFTAHKEASPISDVSVFRYLLIPTKTEKFDPNKRDTIAHILDEELSSYLKSKLKPPFTSSNLSSAVRKKVHFLDCHILPVTHMLRPHKLACFDMDSTLIKQEVIVELAKVAGVGEQVNKITEQAMRGEIDFATSFTRRVALLRGLKASVIDEICPLLIPNSGAFATIAALKALGYRTVLISGGFAPFAKHVATLLGMDNYYANPLDIDNGRLTGEVIAPILDGAFKAKIVQKLTQVMNIGLDQVVCIGDGANDLPMMNISDLGIAYHAKPIVQAKADTAINVTGLEGVLYALGYPKLESMP